MRSPKWLAALCVASFAAPAAAGFIEQSYDDYSKYLSEEIDDLAKHLDLSVLDKRLVAQSAGLWVHIGPCRGTFKGDSYGVHQAMAMPDTTRKFNVALLAAITLITRDNLGRTSDRSCKYAKSLADLPVP